MNGVGDDDCATCGPKVTTAEDVKDVPVPQWKKDALAKGGAGDTTAAPFGMSWDVEAKTAATPAAAPTPAAPPAVADTSHDHKHEHSHGHDHGH
eukprot:scaffold189266_cov52-Attheya_sp.AAC.3